MAKKKIKANKPQKQQKNKREITQRVVSYFNNHPDEALNYKQVGAGIEATSQTEKLVVASVLETLLSEDYLVQTDRGKYRLNNICSIAEGIFERRSNGKNSFIPDAGGNPIFVAERNSLYAMNKDRVRVQIFARRKGRDPEAEVIEIIQRKQDTVVGILEVSKYYAYLIVDSKIWANDIFIPKDKLKDGRTGQKAIVRIVGWPDRAKNPVGEVVDILGNMGDNRTEMHAILAEFGLPYKYPESMEKAAKKIPAQISCDEIARREDFRDTVTFTVDPKDAKDFDDALSLKKLPDEWWEVGVHIADVTHYVKPDTAIDKEASERATSVYLVDRTIPMLPELLSNNLCSLRPKEDKLCFSVIFEMNDKAEIRRYRIKRTVINSNRRLHYDEAQEIIEKGVAREEVEQAILHVDRLAKILRGKRFAHGAINFERDEIKFDIDENGKPLRAYFREEKDANRLIEEFMLLANRTVAEFIGKTPKGVKAKTFVYRVHDEPNPEKMANFMQFVRRLGYKIKEEKSKGKNNETSRSINRLLADVQGKKEQNLVETVAVRTMAKAAYTTVNIGHYGLAFDYYTHFTSPIRRYPDMMTHRLLERYLAGGRSVSEQKTEDSCKHCSDMETLASQAERASIKYKQVEFMSDKVGMAFDGVISGVTEWGLYVELNENHCEGMVPIRELNGDFYEFDEKTYSLIGKRTKKRYLLGDPIRIRVTRTNLEKKQLDFTLEQ
ncbi:MAG: ribonuclease R [Dysgonamonadaceae bacterium]|jgi:ribonuclease R|nr:ribonuclease R [Dysgonamonadaceae bacterium]